MARLGDPREVKIGSPLARSDRGEEEKGQG
jgi:hypothetical protein